MVTAPKTRLVQKQPHLLAYITPAEAALLKMNGGTGEMVNGIPAFRPVKGKTQGRSDAGTGFSGGSSGGGRASVPNPGDIDWCVQIPLADAASLYTGGMRQDLLRLW
jgi:hypothetical protein